VEILKYYSHVPKGSVKSENTISLANQRRLVFMDKNQDFHEQSLKISIWASADFFPGEGKKLPGGQEPTFSLKITKKILFFPKKSKNILFLAGQGGTVRFSDEVCEVRYFWNFFYFVLKLKKIAVLI
jgi:hypothetical protein